MSRRKTDIGSSAGAQYTRSFGNLRGVDFSSDPSQVDATRPTYLINMYRDYASEHGAAIETIPGYRRLFRLKGTVHGIWGYSSSQDESCEKYLVVHAGTKLYTVKLAEKDSGVYNERYDGLRDAPSSAFLQNNRFYICDGKSIYVMREDLSVASIADEAYVPITYLHGAPYEQRNMVGSRFINRDTAAAVDFVVPNVTYLSEDYSVDVNIQHFVPEARMTAEEQEAYLAAYLAQFDVTQEGTVYRVHGYLGTHRDELVVLSSTAEASAAYAEEGAGWSWTYDHKKYRVEFDEAFRAKIRRVIAGYQFRCEAYETEEEIEGEWRPTIGYRLVRGFGEARWRKLFPNLQEVYEYGVDDPFPFEGASVAEVFLYDPCESVEKVLVNEASIPRYEKGVDAPVFYLTVSEKLGEKEYVSRVYLYAARRGDIANAVVDVHGIAEAVSFGRAGEEAAGDTGHTVHTDYMTANTEYDGTAQEAILGCRYCATFDGRVFLTGNPKLPNTVFYSCRDLTGYNNPTYFGVYNYFNDGEGNESNVALLATANVLMVLKGNTMQGSSIYYHVGADGVDDVVPRIYPSTPGVAGLGCVGPVLNFLDDAVFLSERGLECVSREQLNLERTVGHRSSNVDRLLVRGDLSRARMCRYEGYICIFDGEGNVYMGDSHQRFVGVDGTPEYEWYYLEGIGDFEDDYECCRMATHFHEIIMEGFPEGYTLEGATVLGEPLHLWESAEIISRDAIYTGNAQVIVGESVYTVPVKYTERDGALYLCEVDGELQGGVFYPATACATVDGCLYFGTKNGAVCCFNMDKRGVAVSGDTPESDAIHRWWYSFSGHGYQTGLALKSDNCGVPHLTKRTTRKTCVMKLKTMPGASVSVKIRTDREPWHKVMTSFAGSAFSFSDMEFDSFSFLSEADTIVTVKDKEKKWVEKQYTIYSEGFRRPFGFYSLTYNYEVQGRVKKG